MSALREAFFYKHMTAAPHDMVSLGLFATAAVVLAAVFLTRAERRPQRVTGIEAGVAGREAAISAG